MCAARVGIISVCVVFLIWLLHSGYGKNLFYAFVLALCAFVAFASSYVLLNKDKIPSLFKFSYTDQYGHHTANQLLIWSSAIEAIKQNPLTGYGTGDGQKAFEEIYEKNEPILKQGDPLNPHNEFFSASLDLGIAGGCLLIATLIIPFIRSIQVKDPIALGFIIIIAFFFCVESVLIRQKGIVFFSFFYSLLQAHQANDKLDSKN
jgi:O-antigen ligase